MKTNIVALFIVFFIFQATNLIAQGDDNFYVPPEAPAPSFASPEVAGLGKYVDFPVSLYTGVPDISIPIYEINYNGLKVPISLSYHSSGITVEQIASWVGLGWSLNAGGVITRSVKGIADDRYSVENIKDSYGNIYNYTDCGYFYCGNKIAEFCTAGTGLTENNFWRLDKGGLDGSPDIYYYNFLGYTGKFIIDHNGNAQLFKQNSNLQIEYDIDLVAHTPITSFTITTSDGIKAAFGIKEDISRRIGLGYSSGMFKYNEPEDPEDIMRGSASPAWYLTEIELLNTGQKINFEYTNDLIITLKKSQQRRDYDQSSNQTFYPIYNDQVTTNKKRLVRIYWDNGEIVFTAGHTREDYDIYQPEGPPSTNDAKALTRIDVYNSQGNITTSYGLDYSYFIGKDINWNHPEGYLSGYSKRLKLDRFYSIDQQGLHSNIYRFGYDESHPMPNRFSHEQDYYGYYNANSARGLNPNGTLLPKFYYYPSTYPDNLYSNMLYQGEFSIFQRQNVLNYIFVNKTDRFGFDDFDLADRTPAFPYTQSYILNEVIYPTGGTVTYEYEPNDFHLDDQNLPGGGVRIKKITAKGFVDDSENIQREYSYHSPNDEDISSGKIISLPQFVKNQYHHPNNPTENAYQVFSSSQAGLEKTHGSYVGYTDVWVTETGNGKEHYEYSLPAAYGAVHADCISPSGECLYNRTENFEKDFDDGSLTPVIGWPYCPNPNYDWARGKLLWKHVTNESGDDVSKELNEFINKNESFVKAYAINAKKTGASIAQTYKYGTYYYLSSWQVLETSESTLYSEDEPDELVTSISYEYGDSHKNLVKKSRSNSQGLNEEVTLIYPEDVTDPQTVKSTQVIIDDLISKRMLSVLLKTEHKIDNTLIDGSIQEFGYRYGDLLPVKFHTYEGSDGYVLQSTIDYKNASPVEIMDDESGKVASFYWAYGGEYPVAAAQNCSESSLKNAIESILADPETFFQNLGDLSQSYNRASWFNFNKTLRSTLPDALIKTYAYIPQVGIIAECGANGSSKYYNYDNFNRLESIRDMGYNILSHYDYNLGFAISDITHKEDYSHGEICDFNFILRGGYNDYTYNWNLYRNDIPVNSSTNESFNPQLTHAGDYKLLASITDNQSGNSESKELHFSVDEIECKFYNKNENQQIEDNIYKSRAGIQSPHNEVITYSCNISTIYDCYIKLTIGGHDYFYDNTGTYSLTMPFGQSQDCSIECIGDLDLQPHCDVELSIQSIQNNTAPISIAPLKLEVN